MAQASNAVPPFREALGWKLAGACTWHAGAVAASNVAWALLLPMSAVSGLLLPSGIMVHLLLYAMQLGAMLGHRAVLSAYDYEPVTIAKLGVHGRSWISLVLTRVLIRGGTSKHAIATAAFVAANAVTACLYLFLYPGTKLGAGSEPSLAWALRFGLLLSACYSFGYLLTRSDVLAYPILQRHRWFRLKERAPQALATAARTVLAALALMLALGCGLPPPRQLYGTVLSGTLCVLGWALGHHCLHIVFSERLVLVGAGDADPNAPLLAVLGSDSPILQDLGLMDVAAMAEGQSGLAAWRRSAVFADETGRSAWSPLAAYMAGEVRDFTAALSAALPSAAADAAGAAGPGGRAPGPAAAAVRWNMLRASPSTAQRRVSREQDMAAWGVRSKYQRVCWCLRGLSGMAVAAQRGEDRYGVVLLCEPTLGDITAALLAAVLALQQYVKLTVAARARQSSSLELLARKVGLVPTGSSASAAAARAAAGAGSEVCRQPVEDVAFALEGAARACLNRLAMAYGDKLRDVLRDARAKPAHGSPAELAGLLSAVLAC